MALRGRFVEVDCLWRRHRLIAELDGHHTHATSMAFERDRARDRALSVEGWRVIRITWRQLRDQAQELEEDLRVLLRSTRPPIS
jgi:very-short-patch-repair endonuclease